MPDGMIIRNVPDGMDQHQVFRMYMQKKNPSEYLPSSKEFQSKYGPTSGSSAMQNFGAGAGAQVANRAASVGNMLGLTSNEDRASLMKQNAPVLDTTGGKVGAFAGDVAATLPASLIPGVGAVGAGAIGGGALGLSDPEAQDGADRLKSTAMGAGLGALGGKLGEMGGGALAKRAERMRITRSQNSVRDATLQGGAKLGLVADPAAMNPTYMNRFLTGIGGKELVEQEAAAANAPKMAQATRDFLGLSEEAPLSMDTLKAIHTSANTAREAVKGSGIPMKFDDEYATAWKAIAGAGQQAERSFPGAGSPGIRAVIAPYKYEPKASGLLTKARGTEITPDRSFKPEDVIDAIKTLREQATELFASRQAGAGRAAIHTAKALEDLVERNLEGQGKHGAELLRNFRAGRVQDAKAFAVERVLNKGTGNIKGEKLARELAKGAPLTGQLKDMANFASSFTTVTREPTRSGGVGTLTTLFGLESALLGHPEGMLLSPARFGIGKLLLSKAYQRRFGTPKYKFGKKAPRLGQLSSRTLAPGYFATKDEQP